MEPRRVTSSQLVREAVARLEQTIGRTYLIWLISVFLSCLSAYASKNIVGNNRELAYAAIRLGLFSALFDLWTIVVINRILLNRSPIWSLDLRFWRYLGMALVILGLLVLLGFLGSPAMIALLLVCLFPLIKTSFWLLALSVERIPPTFADVWKQTDGFISPLLGAFVISVLPLIIVYVAASPIWWSNAEYGAFWTVFVRPVFSTLSTAFIVSLYAVLYDWSKVQSKIE